MNVLYGNDIAILAVGSMVYPALMAAKKLEQQDISCEVVNCRFIKPIDLQCLKNRAPASTAAWFSQN